MNDLVIIRVPINPVPFARAGANGKRRFTPARQANFMAQVRSFAATAMEGREPFSGPVEMIARFSYSRPKSWSKKKADATRWKSSKPDVDNLVKIIGDSLNAVAFHDDAQIASVSVQKMYGERSEVVITVSQLEDADVDRP